MQFSSTGNNAWLFQKAYYQDFDWKRKDKDPYAPEFFNSRLQWLKDTAHIDKENTDANTRIKLFTLYPGMATGVGINHESKSKGELSLGFEFDYTIGMPVLRGHGVKGALRAAFPQDKSKAKYKKEKAYQLHCWINNLPLTPEGFTGFLNDDQLYQNIVATENEIFEGKLNGKLLSNYKQDTFFDAYITGVSNYKTTLNQYLGADSITPHVRKNMSYNASMLKNPIPIPFLKILPGIAFEFRFALHSNGLLTAEAKKQLFKKILLENGVGAKTNVGYGQFSSELPKSATVNMGDAGQGNSSAQDEIPNLFYPLLKKNKTFTGKVQSLHENEIVFLIDLPAGYQPAKGVHVREADKTMTIVKKKDKIKGEPTPGAAVQLSVENDYIFGSKLVCKIKLV